MNAAATQIPTCEQTLRQQTLLSSTWEVASRFQGWNSLRRRPRASALG
jgi:hypothetical protein